MKVTGTITPETAPGFSQGAHATTWCCAVALNATAEEPTRSLFRAAADIALTSGNRDKNKGAAAFIPTIPGAGGTARGICFGTGSETNDDNDFIDDEDGGAGTGGQNMALAMTNSMASRGKTRCSAGMTATH